MDDDSILDTDAMLWPPNRKHREELRARNARIVAMRTEGQTLAVIAALFGVSSRTVTLVCQRAGLGDVRVKAPPPKSLAGNPERLAKIIRLREVEGLSFIAIGERLGCSSTTTQKAYAEAKRG